MWVGKERGKSKGKRGAGAVADSLPPNEGLE